MFSSSKVAHMVLRAANKLPSRGASPNAVLYSRMLSATTKSLAASKQHIVVALGGNALLQRGQPMTVSNQRENIASALSSLEKVLKENTITFVHGNGPQVGLLALEESLFQKETGSPEQMKLDVLDAETEGMIGYLIEQDLLSRLGPERGIVTVLSQIIVDPNDPAFQNPTKFIGPVYNEEEARQLNLVRDSVEYFRKGDEFYKLDGKHHVRRVVPSPLPQKIVDQEMHAVRLLTDHDCVVICAGGGGIPVVQDPNSDKLRGIEAVIDKDRAATMLGLDLNADGLMILTDVSGVAKDFGTPHEMWIKAVSPQQLQKMKGSFPAGSMGPKVESAIDFVSKSGGWSSIGSLKEAEKMMKRQTGTFITNEYGPDHIEFYSKDCHEQVAC